MAYLARNVLVWMFYTEDEAVRYLRLDDDRNPGRTLRYYRERGLLRATHLGRHLFYRLVELEEFLERLTAAKASRRPGHFRRHIDCRRTQRIARSRFYVSSGPGDSHEPEACWHGSPRTSRYPSARFVRGHIRRVGIETTAPMTIHTFRKSFGRNHANAGTPIHVSQQLTGHASITTTREFYLQAADANERDALARYETLLEAHAEETCPKKRVRAGFSAARR